MSLVTYEETVTINTKRRSSPAIWGDAYDLILGVACGEIDGLHFFDDFDTPNFTVPTTEGSYGRYKAFSSTGGTITPAASARGGIVTLGSDGDNEGAALATTSPPFQISLLEGKFWFESRVKFNTIAVTQYDAFIGLGELMTLTAAVPITATAGALADQNMVGFLRPGTSTAGDGSIIRTTYKANGVTAVTLQDTAAALVADTYIKLGMKFDPADGYLRFFINNIELSVRKLIPNATGTDFPADVVMGPIAGVTNTAAVTSLFTIDWWKFFQLGSAATQ